MLQKKDAQEPRRRTAVYPKHSVRTSEVNCKVRGWRTNTGLNLEFWGTPRYGDRGSLLRKPSLLRG